LKKLTIITRVDYMNQLILGDNLEIMRKMESESIDLIYLDPPFFSNRNYEVIWGDKGEVRSFEDRWSGGIDHYIAWLKERVAEMHRLLKPTGSIYLHCDWHADAYIRVYILDKVFGENNFRNHITWQRTNAHNDARKKMPNLCDTIYFYAKSNKHEYRAQFAELSEKYKDDFYRNIDGKGTFMSGDITGPRVNPQDKEWKDFHPAKSGRSWSVPNIIVEKLVGKEKCKEMSIIEKLDLLFENDYIYFTKNGTPRVKRYIDDSKGVVVGDNWTDIKPVQSQATEKIGYPTQKPEKLIERIILASSNEGDIVFDPFVGGGTTIVVADKLKRKWIGIDQSVQAIKVSEMRLENQKNLFSLPYSVQLHKYDYDTLRYKDAFEFEKWIVEQFGGLSNIRQRSDFGMDGKTREGIPIQVKRSDNIGRNVIDNFHSSLQRYDKALYDKNIKLGNTAGYIIAFSFGTGAIQEVARLQNEGNIIKKAVLFLILVFVLASCGDNKNKTKITSEIIELKLDYSRIPSYCNPDSYKIVKIPKGYLIQLPGGTLWNDYSIFFSRNPTVYNTAQEAQSVINKLAKESKQNWINSCGTEF